MSKKAKGFNFEFGTVIDDSDQIKIDMDSSQFTHDDINDLVIDVNDSDFLPVSDVKEGEETITFFYQKTNELKNLNRIKKEKKPVKISIAKQILEQNILNRYKDKNIDISLNPSTIYYYPMKTVKYTYVANKYMPKTQYTTLERYKACIVSILTNISYQKCLDEQDDVKKNTNELIKEIYNQDNRIELFDLLNSSEDFIHYDYISTHDSKEKKKNRNYQLALGGLFLVGFIGVMLVQLNASSSQMAMANDYEQQLEKQDTKFQANQAFQNGNYEEAINLHEQAGTNTTEVANQLAQQGQYQLAIDTDESALETVIQHAYNNDNQDQVTQLDDSQLSEESTSKLNDEISIINGDTASMENTLNFLDDENTAIRLAQKYIELEDYDSVQRVKEKYPDKETINQLAKQAQLQSEKQDLQSQIDDLNNEKDDLNEDDDSDRIDEIDSQIDDLNNQIDEINNQLDNLTNNKQS